MPRTRRKTARKRVTKSPKRPRTMSNPDIHGVRVEWPGTCKTCGKPNNVWYDHANCHAEDLRRVAEQIGRRAAQVRNATIYDLLLRGPATPPTTNKPSDVMMVHDDLVRMTDQPTKETPMKTKKKPAPLSTKVPLPPNISVTYGCALCGEGFKSLAEATQHQDLIKVAKLINKLSGGGEADADQDAFCGQADNLGRTLKPDPELKMGFQTEAQQAARTTAKELIAALTQVYLR